MPSGAGRSREETVGAPRRQALEEIDDAAREKTVISHEAVVVGAFQFPEVVVDDPLVDARDEQ